LLRKIDLFAIQKLVASLPTLRTTEQRVLNQLIYLGRKHGTIRFTQRGLANYFQYREVAPGSEKGVRNILKRLEEKGFIKVHRPPHKERPKETPNTYTLLTGWFTQKIKALFQRALRHQEPPPPRQTPSYFDAGRFANKQRIINTHPKAIQYAISETKRRLGNIPYPMAYAAAIAARVHTRYCEEDEAAKASKESMIHPDISAKLGGIVKLFAPHRSMSHRDIDKRKNEMLKKARASGL